MPAAPLHLAILGTGPIGLGAAALALSRGHAATAWSPRGTTPPGPLPLTTEGALTHAATLPIAPTLPEAIEHADAVLVATPANAYRTTFEALAPALRPGTPVILGGHLSLAALALARSLAEHGKSAPIAAWGTTITSGRRPTPGHVRVSAIRGEVDLAALPRTEGPAMRALCQALFGDRFTLRENLLAIALSNANPQNHLAIALCNLSRMEKGEAWPQYANITPAIARLMEALDAERLAIAGALGVQVRTLRQHLSRSFSVPEGPVADQVAALAARPNDPLAPATLQTRYVLEDAPFGLHPTALLGRIAARPATLHESGLALLSALYGRDLASLNDILPPLGLDTIDPARLTHLAEHGWPPA